MALRVWLPLNGNLDSIGCSRNTATNIGSATYSNSGKIGKCLSSTVNMTTYVTNPDVYRLFYQTSQISLCCWVKLTHNAASGWIIRAGSSSTNLECRGLWWADSEARYVWNEGDGGQRMLGGASSAAADYTNWHHLAITIDKTDSSGFIENTYLDGVFVGTRTSSPSSRTAMVESQLLYLNSWLALINDVRIYDHCLSALEIKEISQGLILHYKLDEGVQSNILTSIASKTATIASGATAVYTGYWYIDTKYTHAITEGTTITVEYDYSVTGVTASTSYLYSQLNTSIVSPSDSMNYTTLTNTPSGHHKGTFKVTAAQATYALSNQSRIRVRLNSSNEGASFTISNIRLYFGDEKKSVLDSSGFNNNGKITGALLTNQDSKRYNFSTYFNGSSYLDTGSNTFSWFQFDKCTISAWIKPTASISGWSGSIGVQQDGANTIKGFSLTDYANSFRAVTVNGSYTTITSGKNLPVNEWHHCAITLNGTELKQYYDGELVKTSTVDWGSATQPTAARFAVGVDFPGTNEMFTGSYSDVRFYVTALSAEDIAALYNIPTHIDKSGKFHTFEFIENGGNSIKKNGVIQCNEIIEEIIPSCQYDSQIYTEPDGSQWIRIYHHNNPGAGSFASTDSFATGVYIDANRWYDATRVCNQLNKWEFLIKYKFTSSGTEYKERWIQTKNPENAVYGDVDAADIIRITTSGYTAGIWGGLYKKNASAYWVMNNGNSGNWWGATGSFSIYQNGIPGYGCKTSGTSGTVTTTGFNDLYVRIDNIQLNAKITKTNNYIGSGFIEK